jgi:hypothetical protein
VLLLQIGRTAGGNPPGTPLGSIFNCHALGISMTTVTKPSTQPPGPGRLPIEPDTQESNPVPPKDDEGYKSDWNVDEKPASAK